MIQKLTFPVLFPCHGKLSKGLALKILAFGCFYGWQLYFVHSVNKT